MTQVFQQCCGLVGVHTKGLVAIAAVGLVLGISHKAAAQEVDVADAALTEILPDILVEGTTLAVKKPAKPRRTAPSASTGSQADNVQAGQQQSPSNAVSATQSADVFGDDFGDQAFDQARDVTPASQLLSNQGSAVSVVTAERLKAQQIRHAGDALRSLPGVSVSRSGSFSGLTQVRIRGAEGNHTLVLIDGIEVNDVSNGEFDFSDLAVNDIEQIEVIRGAHSSLYGSGAIGGVINIVTRSGKGPLQIQAHGEAGSFATRQGGFSISAGSDDVWGRLSYVNRKSGGFNIAPLGDEDDGAERTQFSLRGGVRIVKGLTLDLTLRRTNNDGERDTEGAVLGQLQEQTDDPSVFSSRNQAEGARLTWETLGGALTHVVAAQHSETRRNDTSPTFVIDTIGERFNYQYTGTLKFATPGAAQIKHTVTGLAGFEEQRFTTQGDFADGVERSRERLAFAGEWIVNFSDQLFVTASVRHDDNSTFENFTTWRTAASWRLAGTGFRPHASVGTAVKEPTMFEQFGLLPGSFTPNPNLVPEESFGWDAGLEWASANRDYVIDVTYFQADLTNQINGLAPGPGFTFTAVNRPGESRREGIEVSGHAKLFAGLSLTAAYTYLDTQTSEGLQEFRRPRHAGRADLTYVGLDDKLLVNVSAIYNGEMDDAVRRVTGFFFGFPVAQNERFTLDDYWLVNVAVSYKVAPGMEIYGRIENLLDENYQEIFGFETAPLAAYAGVRLTYVEEQTRAWSEGR